MVQQNLQFNAEYKPVKENISATNIKVHEPAVSNSATQPVQADASLQYPPPYTYPPAQHVNVPKQQYLPSPNPAQASVGAVHIQIYNPTVNGQGQNGQTQGGHSYAASMPYPYNSAQNVNQQVNVPNQNLATNPQGTNPNISNSNINNVPAANPLNNEKEAKKKKKEIVQLTDSYIKTLENYLNNPNADVRLQGVKEVLSRFKEEKNRRNDIALTKLMNKALQDPSQKIRLLMLATIDAGYANGDGETVQILRQMQKSDQVYNQDALLASQVLLKMAGKKINVTTDEVASTSLKDQTKGKKLDVVSTV